MTPLLAKRLALITAALPTDDSIVISSSLVIVIGSPPLVFKVVAPFGISPDTIVFDRTCLRSNAFSLSMFSGFKRSARSLAGILSKASSLGAKTVNGPSPLRVSTNFAAVTALTRIDRFWFDTAASTIFCNLKSEK